METLLCTTVTFSSRPFGNKVAQISRTRLESGMCTLPENVRRESDVSPRTKAPGWCGWTSYVVVSIVSSRSTIKHVRKWWLRSGHGFGLPKATASFALSNPLENKEAHIQSPRNEGAVSLRRTFGSYCRLACFMSRCASLFNELQCSRHVVLVRTTLKRPKCQTTLLCLSTH